MRFLGFVAAVAVAGWILTSTAPAASIGVHFPSDRGNARLAADEMAGVPGVAQRNWNSADGGADAVANASGDTTTISLPNAGMLTDDGGMTVAASVEWTSNGTWNTTNGVAAPDAKLMNGYIDAIGADDPFSRVSFTGVPYDLYDVYVYLGSDGNGRTAQVTDGTTTYSYSTFSNDPNGGGGFDPVSDYVQTTDTGGGNPSANYAVFENLTGSSVSVEVIRGSNNSGFHAVQIVQVPEPSTLVLAGLGCLLASSVMIRRRR